MGLSRGLGSMRHFGSVSLCLQELLARWGPFLRSEISCYFNFAQVATKSILLLTCRSSPHTDPKLDAQARRKAVDLHNTDICLDVVPVCGPQEAFHQEKFYADLIKLAEDEVSLGVLPLEELSDSVLKKTTAKRSNGRLKLDLGGTVIAVSSFNLTRKMNKPSKQRMTADTNEEVTVLLLWKAFALIDDNFDR